MHGFVTEKDAVKRLRRQLLNKISKETFEVCDRRWKEHVGATTGILGHINRMNERAGFAKPMALHCTINEKALCGKLEFVVCYGPSNLCTEFYYTKLDLPIEDFARFQSILSQNHAMCLLVFQSDELVVPIYCQKIFTH